MGQLIDLGVRQFSFIPLVNFNEEFINHLSECRAAPSFRGKKASKSDYILVISQDCDIAGSFEYIELLVFRKAKAKDAKNSDSIEYARNFQKILVRDKDNYLLKREEISLVEKEELLRELTFLKERDGRVPLSNFVNENTENILLAWLVNYYVRRPLPHGFNIILFNKYLRNPEAHPLQVFLLKYFKEIVDLYVFVSPMDNESATSYDVTLTALLHESCPEDKAAIIEDELRSYVNEIDREESCLNMMQVHGDIKHDNALVEYVVRPEDFSRKDENYLRRLTLDFLCWMPKDAE